MKERQPTHLVNTHHFPDEKSIRSEGALFTLSCVSHKRLETLTAMTTTCCWPLPRTAVRPEARMEGWGPWTQRLHSFFPASQTSNLYIGADPRVHSLVLRDLLYPKLLSFNEVSKQMICGAGVSWFQYLPDSLVAP